MRHRRPANSKHHKADFSRTARRTHKKNIQQGPMRGGIRL